MPKIAILSDIHANLHALDAVLKDADAAGAAGIFFGGDTVGYGADPAGCVAKVRERGGKSVLGNHDFYTLEIRENPRMVPPHLRETNPVWAGVVHAAESLEDEHFDWLDSLPLEMSIDGAVIAHAALHKPHDWPYLHSQRDAAPTLRELANREVSLGFFGHTHRQELFADRGARSLPEFLEDDRVHIPEGARCAVVVGSVGQPRGNDEDLRAGWVLWDSDERIVEFRRTEYPAVEAAIQILVAGLPAHSAHRLVDDATFAKLRKTLVK